MEQQEGLGWAIPSFQKWRSDQIIYHDSNLTPFLYSLRQRRCRALPVQHLFREMASPLQPRGSGYVEIILIFDQSYGQGGHGESIPLKNPAVDVTIRMAKLLRSRATAWMGGNQKRSRNRELSSLILPNKSSQHFSRERSTEFQMPQSLVFTRIDDRGIFFLSKMQRRFCS